ncbi:hypothetical protein AB6N35_16975 [Dietzia cinnamea]|uniref:HNH endonuclease n=1 Tax=Dietzia cinnamea TaxID=321318 RepID=A0ABV3YLY6_9ACTN|nr:hypothetical protein [Dietzia cinnamea]MCT2121099.1 hypothetical protein [Dietzia cinnamea]MCT2145378.1 hypothetical protein [Dietzia cinnamea]
MTSHTDPRTSTAGVDIPLPGLELITPAPTLSGAVRRSRPYSATLPPTQAAIDAFWSRVVKAPGDGCWFLISAISGVDGYTRLTWRLGGVSRTESGHRFALLLAGQLADGVVAEHRCNEPLCVRVDPGHVVASTQSANLRYAVACGRTGAIRNPAQHTNRHARSVAVRDALASGWDERAYSRACGNAAPPNTPPLF